MSVSDDLEPWIFPLDSEGLGGRSARGFLVTVIAQGAKTILTGVSAIVLSRLLQASDFGLLALISPVTGLLALLSNTGLFQAIVQTDRITRTQVESLFWVSICIGLFLTLIFLGAAPILASVFHNKGIIAVTIALSPGIIMAAAASVPIALLNRTMNFYKIAIIETFSLFFSTAASVVFSFIGFGYWALVYGQLAGGLSVLTLAWVLSPWKPSSIVLHFAKIKGMLAFGRNLTVANVAGYLNASVDNMIVGYKLGEYSLGLYDRAWKLGVLPLNQLLGPISRIALPSLSRLVNDPARYRRHFKAMLELMLLVSGPGLIAAIFSASLVVPGLLGERWRDLVPVFQWLCVGGLVTPINGALFWLFTSQGRSEEQVFYTVTAIAINIAAYIVGVFWGLEGVVRTSAISVYVLQLPFIVYGACRRGPVSRQDLTNALVTPTFAVVATIGSCALVWRYLQPTTFSGVIAFFVQTYVVALCTMLVTANGRSMIHDVRLVIISAVAKRT